MATNDPPQDSKIFDDILSLLKHLEAEHDPEMHLYRGQIKRFTHNWVDENGPITLESLYPSDYRFITKYSSPDEFTFADIPAARSYGRNIRDMFLTTMTVKAVMGHPDWVWLKDELEEFFEYISWLTEQRESGQSLEKIAKESAEDISHMSTRLTRVFWSLAQHYLIATALTDVTFSPRVAAWFATQPWDVDEESPTDGKGVIYRFNLPCLESVLREQTVSMTEWARARGDARPPDLFFVDIRDIPGAFAGRPSGQQGGSVYGFDQPKVLKAIAEKGCLEVFEFRHGDRAAELKPLRQITVPKDDSFTELAEGISEVIARATRADVSVISPDGVLVDPDATIILSALKIDAGLAIDKALLHSRVPLGDEYKGYLFIDIESSGHHGYIALLAVVNEKTDGILGYVSLEPLKHTTGALPGVFYIIATWFNRIRMVVDITAGPEVLPNFLDKAIPFAKQAIGRDPNAATRSALEQIIEHFGGPFEASKSLAQYFEMGDLDSGVNLGMLLVGMGKFDEGVKVLKGAYALGSANAAINLGLIFEQRKSYQEAETWFLKALEMGDREAHYCLGRALESQGDWKQAEYYYRLAHEVDGDHRAPNNLGISLYKLGRRKEAQRYLKIGALAGDELAAYNLETLDWEVP